MAVGVNFCKIGECEQGMCNSSSNILIFWDIILHIYTCLGTKGALNLFPLYPIICIYVYASKIYCSMCKYYSNDLKLGILTLYTM